MAIVEWLAAQYTEGASGETRVIVVAHNQERERLQRVTHRMAQASLSLSHDPSCEECRKETRKSPRRFAHPLELIYAMQQAGEGPMMMQGTGDRTPRPCGKHTPFQDWQIVTLTMLREGALRGRKNIRLAMDNADIYLRELAGPFPLDLVTATDE